MQADVPGRPYPEQPDPAHPDRLAHRVPDQHFDLAVIGSGSGNSLFTEELSWMRIALIEERDPFGGTCLNVGCIPTKMFVHSADVANTAEGGARFGVDATVNDVRWRDIRDRIFGRIDPIAAAGKRFRQTSERITLFSTHAEFAGRRALRLGTGEHITADRVVLAAGSRPAVSEVFTSSDVPFHTSDTVMRIEAVPPRLAIVGGGFIASEFAHIFSALGSAVTVITRGDRMLSHLDGDVSARFTELAARRWDVRRGVQVERAVRNGPGVRLGLSDGGDVCADLVLVAIGRIPNGDRLNAAAGGVALDEQGRTVVDGFQRTTAEGVWALGDVSSPQKLKHVANFDARVVAHNLAHPKDLIRSRHDIVPAAVFSDPQIATVGLTGDQARAAGRHFQELTQFYAGTAYGWALEDTTSFCKLIVEAGTGQLLGAHIMGPEASILIQPLVQAMASGLSVLEMARMQYWIHPALTEVVENALLQFHPPG